MDQTLILFIVEFCVLAAAIVGFFVKVGGQQEEMKSEIDNVHSKLNAQGQTLAKVHTLVESIERRTNGK